MTKNIKYVKYISDFETTVYDGQERTDVWAAATVRLDDTNDYDRVSIHSSIKEFMRYFDKKLYKENCKVYFHNLKFDGSFILDYLLHDTKMQAWTVEDANGNEIFIKYESPRDILNNKYTYSISNKGLWYSIIIKKHDHVLMFVDSLKLLPFTVRKIGKDFKLEHQKLEMEYEGKRVPGGEISADEERYIKNDVLVVKEALNFMEENGHDSLTIGSCCMKEYKKMWSKEGWDLFFPNIYEHNEVAPDGQTAGEYVRRAYRGGWCYVVPEKANKIYHNGTTADVNSLYPSMMHSESGNRFPVGLPTFWKGEIPEEAKADDKYYFVRVKTRFKIKKDKLPCIMIKDSYMYHPREWLRCSDYIDKDGKAWDHIKDSNKIIPCRPELVLTMSDWELIQEQYDLYDTEIMDGCYFDTMIGLFDDYINYWADIKMNSTGAMRQLAKLFLNNLYGKFATSTDSSYKVCFLTDNDELRMYDVEQHDKKPGYIPVGAAITSYARCFTIRAAQANYHGPNKPGFIYADTDSIHCDLLPDQIVDAPEDPVKFNHWKYESCWNMAKFIRAKTYVEHITHDNRQPLDKPYYDVKCAGMGERAKQNLIWSVEGVYNSETKSWDLNKISKKDLNSLTPDERKFIKTKRTFEEDYKIGLEVPGSLKCKHIPGGTVLKNDFFKMRPSYLL